MIRTLVILAPGASAGAAYREPAQEDPVRDTWPSGPSARASLGTSVVASGICVLRGPARGRGVRRRAVR
ncbi:hypothetical protein [Promicromonospora iranensis]|uniref:hypothetical protein n=1 Tax=Promicromonospora iranensis TaxID=1105144 RepID=UPI0023A98ABE|nr:hypothetical protein [Promicromonospora iranensis]